MSKCNYLLQCITVTNEILAKIESLFFKFLWNDKNEKIKRKQLTQNYENGGIKMADVKTQLKTIKIKWVNRLISGDEMNWKVIPKYYFNKYGNYYLVFKMNFGGIKELKDIKIPSFYKNILETWVNEGGGNSSEPKNFESIRKIFYGVISLSNARESLHCTKPGLTLILYMSMIYSPQQAMLTLPTSTRSLKTNTIG